MTTEWVNILEKGYPDLRLQGFQTVCRVRIKLVSGDERFAHYLGYGRFMIDGWSKLDRIVAWRLENDQQ